MKFTVEFLDGVIRVISGSEVQYAAEVAFGYEGGMAVMHVKKELNAPDVKEPISQFQYMDGKA